MTEKTVAVFGLANRYPLGNRLHRCALKNSSEVPPKERYDIIRKFPDNKIHRIMEFHNRCAYERESGFLLNR